MANGHGGARPGAGRPPGSQNRVNDPRLIELIENGLSPLHCMIVMMNESWARYQSLRNREVVNMDALIAEEGRCFEYASRAAPYVHPRLAQVKTDSGGGDTSYRFELNHDEANL